MPSSVVRTFTDPDAYFAGMRNLHIEGLVMQRANSAPNRPISTCSDCLCIAPTRTCLAS